MPASGQAVTLRTDVAASFLRRDADGGEPAHQRRRVVDMDEVKLKILARRHVGDAVGIFFGEIGQESPTAPAFRPPNGILMRIIPGASHKVSGPLIDVGGELELLHAFAVVALAVVVALAIDAAAQPGLGENFFVDLALLAQLHLLLEDIDLAAEFGGNITRELSSTSSRQQSVAKLQNQQENARMLSAPLRMVIRVHSRPFVV